MIIKLPNSLVLYNSLAIFLGIAIPTSVVLTNLLFILLIIIILLEGDYKNRIRFLARHPLVKIGLLLFTFMLVGTIYSPASAKEMVNNLLKYKELIYIPFLMLLFREARTRELGLQAFIATMVVTLILSYLVFLTGWPIGNGTVDSPHIFKSYITESIFLSLTAYFLAIYAWNNRKWRILLATGSILAIYNVFFISAGRTGYVVLGCLIVLFMYQCYHKKGILLGSLAVIILSLTAYFTSDMLHSRIDKIADNLQNYEQGETHTSIGSRLEYLKISLELIKEHPLLGNGTGSFAHRYQEFTEATHLTSNPHNEYLMMTVQWGVIGLSLFLLLLYHSWRLIRHLDYPTNWMARGLWITMVVGCLVNSLLLDFSEGHLFIYLMGVFYSGIRD